MGVDLSKAAIALLGVVALRHFMNRQSAAPEAASAGGLEGGLGGLLGGLGGMLGGAAAGTTLSGGLNDLLDGLRQSGHGETANSWVGTGANKPIQPSQLEQAISPDVLNTLAQQTGLSKDELLDRLAQHLPSAIDQMTPHGRTPTADEVSNIWNRTA